MPVVAICRTVILFVPNMMAFGGVATGSMKAHEAAIVAGIIRSRGGILKDEAIPASMGSIIWVEAVFEVNSVSISMPAIISIIIKGMGR